MKPVRTPSSNATFELEGGTRENDLPLERTQVDGEAVLRSTWELTDEERQAIANGANVRLTTWGVRTPPVELDVEGVEP